MDGEDRISQLKSPHGRRPLFDDYSRYRIIIKILTSPSRNLTLPSIGIVELHADWCFVTLQADVLLPD
jgi:hypothetical protein